LFAIATYPGGVTSMKMRPYSYVPAWPNFQLVLGFDASAPIFVWHIGVFPGCLCAQGVWVGQSVDRRLSSSVLVPPAGGGGRAGGSRGALRLPGIRRGAIDHRCRLHHRQRSHRELTAICAAATRTASAARNSPAAGCTRVHRDHAPFAQACSRRMLDKPLRGIQHHGGTTTCGIP
jgi:hypothetical protein